jgi:hypothetical protein
MEKYTILRNGDIFNKNINIDLSNNFTFTKDEDINNFVAEELIKNTNPIVDKEIKRYNPSIPSDFFINLTYMNKGYDYFFTTTELKTTNKRFINSFFIMDYFDSIDRNQQNKLHTSIFYPKNYVTRYNTSIIIPFNINDNLLDDEHVFLYKQLNKTITKIYLAIKFFNAKDGKVYYFKKNTPDTDLINYYLELNIINNNTYIFENSQIISNFIPMIGYTNPTKLAEETNNQPELTTSDNTEKGDFINTDGKYQNGSTIDNTQC